MLYVLYVLYLTRQAAEPPLSPGSLLYVLYVLYLTRQAAEPPLSPGSLLYVLYVLYVLYARNLWYMCYIGPYSTYSTYSKEPGESGCSVACLVRYSTYSTYSKEPGESEGSAWRLPRLPGIEASRPRQPADVLRCRVRDCCLCLAQLALFSLACPAVFWSDVLWKKGSFFSLALDVDCHEFAMDVF